MGNYTISPGGATASTTTGSSTGVPYSVGTLDAATANAQGGTIGSFSLYQQSASVTVPGLVNNTTQSFSGVKTFASGLVGSVTGEASLNILTSAKGQANGVASLDASALIPITQIPPSALERLVIVADEAARYALTTATVTNGDTVKQTDTITMYFVIDDTNLGNASGYSIYTAGTAASVAWSGVTGVPAPVSTVAGSNSGDMSLTVVGTAANENGASLSGQALTLQPASAGYPGIVSSTTQTFSGLKIFNGVDDNVLVRLSSPLTYPLTTSSAAYQTLQFGRIAADWGVSEIKNVIKLDVSLGSNLIFRTSDSSNIVRDRMALGADGNVAIGSTGAQAKLHVFGSIMANAAQKIGFRYAVTGADIYQYMTANNGTALQFYCNFSNAESQKNYSFYTTGNNVESVTVMGSGYVGLGNTAPNYRLHLLGVGQATANMVDAGSQGGSMLISDFVGNTGNGGAILFGARTSDGDKAQASIKSLLTNGSGSGTADLAFSTRAAIGDTALTERARILASGKVGIGTAAPGYLLDVAGSSSSISHVLKGAVAGAFTMEATSSVTSYSVTWPQTQGSSSSSILSNNGAGLLSWLALTPYSLQTFTTGGNYTYTPRSGTKNVIAIATGPGGPGGPGGSGGTQSSGGGGGAGETRIGIFTIASVSPTLSITIGVSGSGSIVGSSTSFGGFLVSVGGSAGAAGVNNTPGGGGTGGTGGSGGFGISGGAGSYGQGSGGVANAAGSSGGGSLWGGGGMGGAQGGAGNAGAAWGSGGGSGGGAGGAAGGLGANGTVVVIEF